MTTQEEKAKWFDESYEIYCEVMQKDELEILDDVTFNDRLQNIIKEKAKDGGFE